MAGGSCSIEAEGQNVFAISGGIMRGAFSMPIALYFLASTASESLLLGVGAPLAVQQSKTELRRDSFFYLASDVGCIVSSEWWGGVIRDRHDSQTVFLHFRKEVAFERRFHICLIFLLLFALWSLCSLFGSLV